MTSETVTRLDAKRAERANAYQSEEQHLSAFFTLRESYMKMLISRNPSVMQSQSDDELWKRAHMLAKQDYCARAEGTKVLVESLGGAETFVFPKTYTLLKAGAFDVR